MRTLFKPALTGALALLFLGTLCVSKATALCGYGGPMAPVQPQRWQEPAPFRPAPFLLVADKGSDDRIVGFWKVEFALEDGTVVDHALAQWHSDGTEIMNSGARSPATGNFCLGVWQKSGRSNYILNHFGLGYDSSGNFIGTSRIYVEVTLDHSGDTYAGTFTSEFHDPSGNLLAHREGKVTATRITVDTPVEEVL